MELILIFAKLAEWLIVEPVWRFCGWVAGFFYPEHANEYLGIAWLVCLSIVFVFIAVIMILVV